MFACCMQSALEGWVRGMEACKSEQEGQRREKEEQLYHELEGLKAQLDAFERRSSALDGETLFMSATCSAGDRGNADALHAEESLMYQTDVPYVYDL